ncbi:MAG: CHAD domain-containing protein [Pseudomonadota bacterium]
MEVELKLLIDPQSRDALLEHPLLAAHATGKPHTNTQTDIYFDTPQLRLRRNAAGLRVRRVAKTFTQTLKQAADGAGALHSRHEWESALPAATPDLALLRRVVDDKRARHALLDARSVKRRLAPVFKTKVKRTVWDLKLQDGDLVECALDEGRLECGGQSVPISELELELKSGDPAHLYAFALALHDSLPMQVGIQSKADRGYALLDPQERSAVKAAALHLSSDMSSEQAFQAIVDNCLAQVQANAGIVADSDDVEGLHQMRVGMRRLRSALNMYKESIRLPDDLQVEVDWLTAQLGAARDWDVLAGTTVETVARELPDTPQIAELRQAASGMRLEKHRQAAAAVKSARYTRLILNLGGWTQGAGWRDGMAPDARTQLSAQLATFARKTMRKDQRRLHTRGKNLQAATPEARHRVRIAAKKTRYAAEFFQSLLPKRQLQPYVQALARLQDELGYLNDATVADRLLGELSAGQTELCGGIGFIKGVLAARVKHDDKQIGKLWRQFARMKLPT